MKKFLGGLLLVVLFLVMGKMVYSREAEESFNPDNLIRLHVIANSDLEEDQQLKYEVRDVILAKLQPNFQQLRNVGEADTEIARNLAEIRQVTETYLEEIGKDVPVRVEYGYFPFPVKAYGSLVLPAGEYQAVRVILGNGQGANWWCVLFPPLCFVDIVHGEPDEASIEEVLRSIRSEEEVYVEAKPQFKFKALELFH